MKKLALLLALLMLLGCTACGKKNDQAPETAAATTPATKPAESDSETTPYQEADPEKCAESEDEKHQYVEELAGEPTCALPGLMMYTCTACGFSTTEEIPAVGHQGTGASCDEPSICTVCGEEAEAAWGHIGDGGICKNCGIDMSDVPVVTQPAEPDGTEPEEEVEATEATVPATEQ